MNKLPTLLLCSALILSSSCSSTRIGSDVRSTNSTMTLTARECEAFGEMIVDAINQSGVISRYYEGNGSFPVVLALGDFINNSPRMGQEVPRTMDAISFSTFEALVNGTGGMISVSTDLKGSGWNLPQGSSQLRGITEYDQSTTTTAGGRKAPALVYSGQFLTIDYSEGRTDRVEYAVNVILTDAKTRETVFAKRVVFHKEMTRGILGG